MSDDDPNAYKVGYGKPPKEHQFQKGQSPNPRGRPRKQERSLMPRQVRNDILSYALKPVRMNTRAGEKKLAAAEALLQVVLAKAMTGHLPSIRYFLGRYEAAIQEHFLVHRDGAFEQLEQLERAIQLASEPVSENLLAHVNQMRRATRSIGRVDVARRNSVKVSKSGSEE